MSERSTSWQALYVVLMSALIWGLALAAAWFADQTGSSLGHGPLPSGLSPRNAYIATLVTVALGAGTGGAMLIGVRQAKYFTRRFAWLLYLLVAAPMLALLITPMQRFGSPAFLGLPEFLMGPPARMVLAASLGALFIGATDLRRLFPGWVNEPAIKAQPARVSATGVRGLPGRFTPNAWRALSFMQEEAQRFEHSHMGTEHLLLGLLRDPRSHSSRVIINLRGDPASMKRDIENSISRRGTLLTGGSGMTRRCQQVIEQGSRLARASGQRVVGTGHLLQSLAEKPEDMASQLLENAGVTVDRIIGELRQLGPESE